MAKEKKFGNTIKTKRFILETDSEKGKFFGTTWVLKYRATKKALKENELFDAEKTLARLELSQLDKYSCTELKLSFYSTLEKDEYDEILTGFLGVLSQTDVCFVRIHKDDVRSHSTLGEAFETAKFMQDELDENMLLWEKPITQWGPIFMLFGLSIGMSFSRTFGIGIGALIGFALGMGLKANETEERNKLKKARLEGTEPPKKENNKSKSKKKK